MINKETEEHLTRFTAWLGSNLTCLEELTGLVEKHPDFEDLTNEIKRTCIYHIDHSEIKYNINYDLIIWPLIATSIVRIKLARD
jgi:hypothetical protein